MHIDEETKDGRKKQASDDEYKNNTEIDDQEELKTPPI